MTPIDTAELERLADECREMGNAAHQQPGASKYMRTLWKAEALIREVLAHRKAEAGMRALLREADDRLLLIAKRLRSAARASYEGASKCPADERETYLAFSEQFRALADLALPSTPTTEASHGE